MKNKVENISLLWEFTFSIKKKKKKCFKEDPGDDFGKDLIQMQSARGIVH